MNKPRIGDIFEIPTAKGLAYAQYTHQHSKLGALIRVFDSLYSSTPSDWGKMVDGPVQFSTFYPLKAAVQRGISRIVAHHQVAEPNRSFPTFRAGIIDPKTRKVSVWWLWDGENEWKIGNLSPEQRKLPIREVWNDTLLVQRIEEGWRPEIDYR
jgi:hypothetical protein